MIVRIFMLAMVCAAVPATAASQTVELIYTPGALQLAVSLKDSLKVHVVHATSALTLVGATVDRRQVYVDKIGRVTAVVIVGEDALKAVAEVEFGRTVIVVNASGPTAALGRVIRIFDGSGTIPPGARFVATTAALPDMISADRIVILKGRPVEPIVQAILVALSQARTNGTRP